MKCIQIRRTRKRKKKEERAYVMILQAKEEYAAEEITQRGNHVEDAKRTFSRSSP
jgi:hypothetical protein